MLDDMDKYEHGMSSVHAYITDTIFSREYRVDKSIGEWLGWYASSYGFLLFTGDSRLIYC